MTSTVRATLASASLFALLTLAPAFAQEQAAPAADAAAPAPAEQPVSEPEAEPAATPAPAAPEAAAPAAPPAAGAVAAPPVGKGQVIFFRPSKLAGAALSFSVHEGEKGVGKLGNGSYFVLTPDPGPHTYTIQSEATDSLTLEVDEGETYYVKQTIGMGIMVGRPHLQPVEASEFNGSKLKLSTKTATDLKPKS